MVRIALRVYNNEIGDLINHGQIEEAVAHCRHILKAHPKHVDTYRLLGKAYLEAQHYSDAADILQRVLSSAPEDFTAHVGMSIIREGEDDLDTAIFHMERAFDSQPSNQAIQDELRRLFGRRDGIEPHKIRLTRGALARMYAHGNLHEQAIAELLAALGEDPQRYELQVLLANMYFQSGKKVEAAEICSKTLEKLSFCLEANRILSIILKENEREEDAKIFYQRWVDLDPYAAHLSDNHTDVDQLQDQVVTIERLEWEPSGGGFQPTVQPSPRSSSGVSIAGEDTGKQAIPDWLAVTSDEPTESSAPIESAPLPDWEASAAAPPVSPQLPDETFGEDLFGGEELPAPAAESEISTDWMAALDSDSSPSGDGDWMADFESQDAVEPPQAAVSGGEQPDWMTEPSESDSDDISPAVTVSEDQPDFSDSISAEPSQPAADSNGEDDWISSLQADTTGEEIGVGDPVDRSTLDEDSGEPASMIPDTTNDEGDFPDFLADSGWSPSSGEAEEPAAFAEPQNIEEGDTPQADMPDWMQGLAPTEGDPAVDDLAGGFSDVQAEADPDWLQSLQSEVGGDSPDWVDDLGQGVSETVEPLSPPASGDASEFLADLNGEAAQDTNGDDFPGVDPLAALTQPDAVANQASDDTEDWLATLGEETDSSPDRAIDPEDFLTNDQLAALTQPDESPTQGTGNTEEWLASLGEESLAGPGGAIDTGNLPAALDASSQSEDDNNLDWLSDLGGEAAQESAQDFGAGESSAEDPLAALSQPDETPVQATGNTEEWLASLGEEPDSGPEVTADPGDFLAALDAPAQRDDDDSLDWLGDLSAEAANEAAQGIGAGETTAEDPLAALSQSDETPVQATGNTEEWLASFDEDSLSDPEGTGDPGEIIASPDIPLQSDEDANLDWINDLNSEAALESSQDSLAGELPAEDPFATLDKLEESPAQAAGDAEDWVAALRQDEQISEEDPVPTWDDGEQQADLKADSDIPAEDLLDTDSAAQPDSTGEITADESTPFEEDDGLAWMESLAAKQGAAEEELITSHDDRPNDAPDWAQEQAEEVPAQPEFETEGINPPQEEVQDEISSDLDKAADGESGASLDWLDEISAEAAEEASSKDEQQWLDSLRDFDAKITPEAETSAPPAPTQESEPMPSVEDQDDELGKMAPDLIQDVIGQTPDPNGISDSPEGFPDDHDQLPGFDVTPTQAEEWLPETEVQDDIPAAVEPAKESKPTPKTPKKRKAKTKTKTKKGKRSSEELIADARQDMRGGSLDLAIDQYGKLIKKGKMVEEVISDIEEALRKHPINVGLWQILGDAYMRLDRLQDALDSYSKAEDLLT